MPAGPCRDRKPPAARVAAQLIAREIDDVGCGRYDFLNHCCPRDLRQRYRRKPSHKRSAQRSNFSSEIEAAVVRGAMVFLTFAASGARSNSLFYSHFFHLKIK